MIHKVLSFIHKKHMINTGEHIMAGVSGGADSVALLLILEQLKQELAFTLSAVHVEHGIRREDSKADALFVRKLCERKQIPFLLYEGNAPAFAKERGLSLEEGAREMRYDFFRQARKEMGRGKIAVAHNQNDSAETLLFHLIRGSGLKGLSGIPAVRSDGRKDVFDILSPDLSGLKELSGDLPLGGEIIRPLLCLSRPEIEEYLAEIGQEYCTDMTNAKNDYSRNKIRNQILPLLQEINFQAVSHLNQVAEMMGETQAFVKKHVNEAKLRHVKMKYETQTVTDIFVKTDKKQQGHENKNVNEGFLSEQIQKEEHFLQSHVVHSFLEDCTHSAKDITKSHIEAVLALLDKQTGKRIALPYGLTARRDYGGIWIEKSIETAGDLESKKNPLLSGEKKTEKSPPYGANIKSENTVFSYEMKPNTKLYLEEENLILSTRLLEKEDWEQEFFPLNKKNIENFDKIFKKTYTKAFDYDKIKSIVCLRKPQAGDYLVIGHEGNRQKLSRYFINQKIPAAQRGDYLLLAEGSHILWIVGQRRSEAGRVSEQTKRVLLISCCLKNLTHGGNT
ncbi:tRNA(Ile)-lysidine synthase [Clostridia bacterium]|nr:tRNA(Ile)-lysidine synthase [Clostridia bacterium]